MPGMFRAPIIQEPGSEGSLHGPKAVMLGDEAGAMNLEPGED